MRQAAPDDGCHPRRMYQPIGSAPAVRVRDCRPASTPLVITAGPREPTASAIEFLRSGPVATDSRCRTSVL